jgi:phospholipid/cholesterol/gamma-HCH transport system substrate-binding protein
VRRRPRLSNPVFGLIAAVVIAVVSWFIFFGVPFGGGFEVAAVVRNAPEIQPGSKVRIAGVNVGTVTGTEPGPGTFATIEFEVEDAGLPLHEDATVKIRPRTFLEGGMFLDLKPGTPNAPVAEEGHVIPVANTSVAVLLGHATADLRLATRQNLRHLFNAINEAFEGNGVEGLHDAQRYVAPAFLAVAQAAEAGQGEEAGDLSGGVDSAGLTMAALASRDAQLAELLTGFNRTVRGLGSRGRELGESLEELDGVLAEARPALADLNEFFPRARVFAAELRPSIRAAPETLRLALPLLDQALGLMSPAELPALLAQADPAVRSLARLEGPLAEILRLATPVLECLRVNGVPTLKTPIEDPPHSTGEPVYRDLLHALPGQAGLAQNFDGNGPSVRFHAGFGDRTVTTSLPGLSESIYALTEQPIIGSRPRFTKKLPPFRPDVPCISQDPPNLKAETGPAPPQSRVKIDSAKLEKGLLRLARVLEKGNRR